ncbi:MAG TPA: glycosyltransferase family 39 protein, partial [Pyrinomonadaceae bacterium]|nr:glycosyltransferase family 39 protein [Pyrinomonadaceae bacterium]
FAALACFYLFRLVCRTHDVTKAAIVVLFFGLSPLVFRLSHFVMLEVPTLALGLAATYYFVVFIEESRRRDLIFAALFSALAALTRFDAVYLPPLFLILIAVGKRWKILARKDVWVVAALALLLVAPFYVISASGIGWLHFKFVTETLSPSVPGFLSIRRFLFYPRLLPSQLGWLTLTPALVGMIYGFSIEQRERAWVYLAIVAATYLTFTPIGELEPRHTIYWIPAFALFAAEGIALITKWLRAPQIYLPLSACVLAGAMWHALLKPLPVLRGYEQAARYVAANTNSSPFCLFMGRLDGNFIYQLRRQDPQRKLWTLRADKVLFSVLIVPGVQYKQLATGDEEILATIYKYDPEFIVMEEAVQAETASADRDEQLRNAFERQVKAAISNHPERFSLEQSIMVSSDEQAYQGMVLKIFRNKYRNENPERRLDLDILMLRRSFQTTVP